MPTPKEKPILFNAEMVRAVLEGRKTQTRRICKLQPHEAASMTWWPDGEGTDTGTLGGAPGCYLKLCPYGQPGGRLWVRETFDPIYGQSPPDRVIEIDYKADWVPQGKHWRMKDVLGTRRWHPSIHMPRWASRILLEITDVRVEQLTKISEQDAQSEGPQKNFISWRDSFCALWQQINGDGSWEKNPWVWVIEFRRVPHE